MRSLAARDLKYLRPDRQPRQGEPNLRAAPGRRHAPGVPRHIHAPIGLDIGAVTPAEIAISIMAELVAIRRGVDTGALAMKRLKIAGSSESSWHAVPSLPRNATILTMDDRLTVADGSVSVRDGRIAAVGDVPDQPHDTVIDARGGYLLPGFIQTHVHLCQTLFRGFADDMPLLEWLRLRVWPMEAAHSPPRSASVQLAAAELLRTGTTSVLTMETVHDTDVVFEALAEIGLRATVGKCMMDSDTEVPRRLQEQTRPRSTRVSRSRSAGTARRTAGSGRLRAAVRGLVLARPARSGCLAVGVGTGARAHARVGEPRRSGSGPPPVRRLLEPGVPRRHRAGDRSALRRPLRLGHRLGAGAARRAQVKVMHCPGSNLKLGSGIAPVAEMRARGISVSLGADGAACNNRLDIFDEMRLAATLRRSARPPARCRPARSSGWRPGRGPRARARSRNRINRGRQEGGSGFARSRPPAPVPVADPWSAIVYSARGTDVRTVLVDGEVLVHDFALTRQDAAEVTATARSAAAELTRRAGL